eukprot:scaffold17808_cov33-Tisochrysis_lutea.AAC.3
MGSSMRIVATSFVLVYNRTSPEMRPSSKPRATRNTGRGAGAAWESPGSGPWNWQGSSPPCKQLAKAGGWCGFSCPSGETCTWHN